MPTTCVVIGCYNDNAEEFTKGFIEFLKGQMSDAIVGWILLTEEVKIENHGSLVMATVFVRAISLTARNQRY